MAAQDFPASNRTWRMLHHARANGYAVGAFNCYNTDAIMAVIRAATRARSPAIIQLFPWTLTFQGPAFVAYAAAAAAAAAPVPVALHLDHCVDAASARLALTLPFDSIMVDAAGTGGALDIAYAAEVAAAARERGVAVEAEVGRIDGREDGVPVAAAEVEAVVTGPAEAAAFVAETGVQFLAPAFGNVHGAYPEGGAERWWQLDRLAAIGESVGPQVPLVLHGTHTVSDELFRKAIRCGVAKINLNRTVRDPYTAFVAKNAGKLELTALKEQAVEIYAKSIERMMGVLGSSGMA